MVLLATVLALLSTASRRKKGQLKQHLRQSRRSQHQIAFQMELAPKRVLRFRSFEEYLPMLQLECEFIFSINESAQE